MTLARVKLNVGSVSFYTGCDLVHLCDCFFQDESHFLKNVKTARCRAAMPLLKVSPAESGLGV